jgi:hypothetical protein
MSLVPQKAWHIEREYGSLDYAGAVVLDIGADYGCTAEFFLARGATHVYASERNEEWLAKLEVWAEGKPVTALGPLTAGSAAALFQTVRPDVVKVDCEGCEAHLIGLPDELLTIPRAWVLETHTPELYLDLWALFGRLGYRLTMIRDYGPEPNRSGLVCKIWKAERD